MILLLDAVLVVAVFAAVRWARSRRTRFVPLIASVPVAAGFVLARNHYDLEDSAFLWTLGLSSALAAALTIVACVPLRQGLRRSTEYAALAAALVPLLFGASLAVRYTLCLVAQCDLS